MIRAIAEDEAFGAEWTSLSRPEAEEIWRGATAAAAPGTVEEAFARVAAAWDLSLRPFDAGRITPAT